MALVTERPAAPHAPPDAPAVPPPSSPQQQPGSTPDGPPGGFAAPPTDRLTRVTERLWVHPAWFAPVALLGCVAGAGALLLANDPTDGRADPLGGCAFKLVTGFDCPGCGGTRALWYLLHGNLPEAARHHAIAVFAAPFLAYLYVAWAGHRIFNLRLPQLRITPRHIGWFLGAWAVFTVVRNLPWAPFTYLYV